MRREIRSWFACVSSCGPAANGAVLSLARECSPRVEVVRDDVVMVDASGLTGLFGGPQAFGAHVQREAASRGLQVRVALAATRTVAVVMACSRPGVTVVPAGHEAGALAPLPLEALAALAGMPERGHVAPRGRGRGGSSARHYRMAPLPDAASGFAHPDGVPATRREHTARGARHRIARPDDECRTILSTFERWGLRTVGEVAALPPGDLFERLGDAGVRWRRLARGEDERPLVREAEEERFQQALDLDWPIEGLEPLSFVLTRLLDPLCGHLERRDRGAVGLHLWLALVTRRLHHRYLQLPAPMRDAKTLRTLLLLDLESHPPDAAVDRVTVAAEPAPGRVAQGSLLARRLPPVDRLSTLTARLTALMGEGRCGTPALLDSHRPGAFDIVPFAPDQAVGQPAAGSPMVRSYGPCDARPDGTSRAGVAGPGRGRRGTSTWAVTGAAHGKAGDGCRRASRSAGVPPQRLLPVDGGDQITPEMRAGRMRAGPGAPCAVLRRFRHPVPARVLVDRDRLVRVTTRHAGLAGGAVVTAAGPWRTSGAWWTLAVPGAGGQGPARGAGSDGSSPGRAAGEERLSPARTAPGTGRPAAGGWDHDEWDVALADGALYRLHRDRSAGAWFVDGIWD